MQTLIPAKHQDSIKTLEENFQHAKYAHIKPLEANKWQGEEGIILY